MIIRKIDKKDMPEVAAIWNEAVKAGEYFMDEETITQDDLWELFCEQTETVVAELNDEIVGFHFIHPNLIGRCSHIANAAYAVSSYARGKGIGEELVKDSICRAKKHGFLGMQFNAVVCTNKAAIALYKKFGFKIIGTIPNGFRTSKNKYVDMLIFLKSWK